MPEAEYVAALLDDLSQDIAAFGEDRPISSIFIGGGTPSLFTPESIARLLAGVRTRITLAPDAEITMEANPGTVEAGRFNGFREAGVNRISIGVQSFDGEKLGRLGRIHDAQQAINAAAFAHQAGLNSFNLDLMHGLPDQSLEQAMADLDQAIALAPPHLSWYQLTIEPNTAFASKPPTLPQDDTLWEIQELGHEKLTRAGYVQYETSAYAKPGYQCQHNLNYWRFGDYLGIGCGAHGKITTQNGDIVRTVKVKHPKGYLDLLRPYLDQKHIVDDSELGFEYMLNRFRLLEPCPKDEFPQRTGLCLSSITPALAKAETMGLITDNQKEWQITPKGQRYLNELLTLFID